MSRNTGKAKISGKELEKISKRSSVGTTALRAMLNRGINIHNHSEIADAILEQPANRRPRAWKGGYIAEHSTRLDSGSQVDALEAVADELPEIDMDQELKRLNSLLSKTTCPDAVDMLAKKISSLAKSVITQSRLDSLVPREIVQEQEQAAMEMVKKHLAPLYESLPSELVNLDVNELCMILQTNVESAVLGLQTELAN